MSSRNARLTSLESEATEWLARRDRGFDPAERLQFDRWLASDPAHREAIETVSNVWAAFDRPSTMGKEDLLASKLASLDHRTRRRRLATISAVSLAAACLAFVLYLRPSASPQRSPAESLASAVRVTQPEHQALPDGSQVDLKPGAQISFDYSGLFRRVTLVRGQALFEVAKDKERPFIVSAAGVEVRAVGTAFSVDLGSSQVEVVVTEGRVSVDKTAPAPVTPSPSEPVNPIAFVDAGKRLVVDTTSRPESQSNPVSVSSSEMSDRLSWRIPRLDFTDASVAEAADLFNGRNPTRLIVADPSVRSLRVTGVFRSDNVDGFVHALESSLGVNAERRPDGSILLKAR